MLFSGKNVINRIYGALDHIPLVFHCH